MAGHSKWANIKRAKAVVDGKRTVQFTKVAREISTITNLTKNGDINSNASLKAAVDRAKALNMTKEKIEKAINRGLGIRDSKEIIFDKTYEFYGPSGSLFLVECETNNPNRSITDMKIISNKYNLKLASEGSISWQFNEVGIIEVENDATFKSRELELLEIDGIKDISEKDERVVITTLREKIREVRDEIEVFGLKVISFSLIKITDNLIKDFNAEELSEIEEEFNSNSDIVNVWKNYENE